MHGGKSLGAPKGNRNAWMHGHYSAEVIALRRLMRRLCRTRQISSSTARGLDRISYHDPTNPTLTVCDAIPTSAQ